MGPLKKKASEKLQLQQQFNTQQNSSRSTYSFLIWKFPNQRFAHPHSHTKQQAMNLAPSTSFSGSASKGARAARGQQQQQLSNVHWDLFHDVQLLERCMRRCLPGSSAQAAQKVVQEAPGEQQQQQQQSVCLILEHVEWAILLATEMHRLVRQIYTPGLQSQMVSSNLAESLQPSWEEYAASLKPGKLKEFALEQAENQNATQLKVVSVRDWLRVLRDASLNIINLVLLHASEMTYSNPSIAGKMQTVIATDLEAQRDDQVRTMVLLFVRPVLSRCPAQFRQIWFQALVAPILPSIVRMTSPCGFGRAAS